MKTVIGYFRAHLAEDFNPLFYLTVGLFLAICIFLNYTFRIDATVIASIDGFVPRFFARLLYYCLPYYAVIFLYAAFCKKRHILLQPGLWLKSLFIISLLAFNAAFYYNKTWIDTFLPADVHIYFLRFSNNLLTFLFIFVPVLVFYRLYDRRQESFYGFTRKGFIWKPYVTMYIIMIPLVCFAATQKSFYHSYPTCLASSFTTGRYIPQWLAIGGYEISYGCSFTAVELAFRGMLVIGMMAVLGRAAIMPMAALYVFCHFGKPPLEAASSALGGYILGVIVYYSRNIWGAVFIHVGIAWLMEIAAFVMRHYVL